MTAEFQFITPSDVIEYLFCPRFVYYMHILKIDQREHKRALVNKGRDMHELKLVQNKDYLRKKVGALDKELDLYLSSIHLRLVGKMDEMIILPEGQAAPLDYKFAYWENRVYKTLQMQQVLYALLIEDNFEYKVDKAFLVYIRSKNHLETIPITTAMKDRALKILDDIFAIINLGHYPKVKASKNKCSDCTYRNICIS